MIKEKKEKKIKGDNKKEERERKRREIESGRKREIASSRFLLSESLTSTPESEGKW